MRGKAAPGSLTASAIEQFEIGASMFSGMNEVSDQLIIFDDVSKFYGEILGVNRVNLQIAPGITSLVGPNGAGKSTLMNLMTGLLQPTRGRVTILGTRTDQPEELFRRVGYCTQ